MNGAFRLGAVAAALRRAVGPGPAPGGFPVLLDTTVHPASTNINPHAITLPATVNAGDLLLMMVQNVAAVARTLTAHVGWDLAIPATGFNQQRVNWLWKIATGTEGGGTQTLSFSGNCYCSARVFRFAAGTFDPTTPVQIAPASGTSGLTADPPLLAPAWGAAATLWLAVAARTHASLAYGFNNWPFPDGQVHYQTAFQGASGMVHRACYAESAVASLDPPAYDLTGGAYDWSAFTVAIRPK